MKIIMKNWRKLLKEETGMAGQEYGSSAAAKQQRRNPQTNYVISYPEEGPMGEFDEWKVKGRMSRRLHVIKALKLIAAIDHRQQSLIDSLSSIRLRKGGECNHGVMASIGTVPGIPSWIKNIPVIGLLFASKFPTYHDDTKLVLNICPRTLRLAHVDPGLNPRRVLDTGYVVEPTLHQRADDMDEPRSSEPTVEMMPAWVQNFGLIIGLAPTLVHELEHIRQVRDGVTLPAWKPDEPFGKDVILSRDRDWAQNLSAMDIERVNAGIEFQADRAAEGWVEKFLHSHIFRELTKEAAREIQKFYWNAYENSSKGKEIGLPPMPGQKWFSMLVQADLRMFSSLHRVSSANRKQFRTWIDKNRLTDTSATPTTPESKHPRVGDRMSPKDLQNLIKKNKSRLEKSKKLIARLVKISDDIQSFAVGDSATSREIEALELKHLKEEIESLKRIESVTVEIIETATKALDAYRIDAERVHDPEVTWQKIIDKTYGPGGIKPSSQLPVKAIKLYHKKKHANCVAKNKEYDRKSGLCK